MTAPTTTISSESSIDNAKMQHRPTLMQFFTFSHLPEGLQAISQPFAALALQMDGLLANNPEKTVMLRKLLEAKDCAVRAAIFQY